ncbi:MAG: hypothetical protein H2046_01995 [Rhizobiales bacterium]|nr:hypothetical protein [Hyphomicrobiales bacterium]
MTKSLASSIAAALIASASFGGAALAAGDYYDGASKNAAASHIDRTQTNSIGDRDQRFTQAPDQTIDRGDYYEGANRPQ